MIKILHAADLHLDSTFASVGEEETAFLREELLTTPNKIAQLCEAEKCDILLLAGDIFDGTYTRRSVIALKNALEQANVPTFISPGNHDFCSSDSPWIRESWPSVVHIFKTPHIESVALPQLDCRIYGAGFISMDCPPLLEDFYAEGREHCHIGVLHGDPTRADSPYNPVTLAQLHKCGLDYLALGHIHKTGQLRAERTLCAWPGCPMGRGFDETEEKGVLLVTLGDRAEARFVALDTPRFHDLRLEVQTTAASALDAALGAVGNRDHYRITLTGTSEKLDLQALKAQFSRFVNLRLLDETQLPVDIWSSVGEDSLEGVFFAKLQESYAQGDESAYLAAQIARKILDGSEVRLP